MAVAVGVEVGGVGGVTVVVGEAMAVSVGVALGAPVGDGTGVGVDDAVISGLGVRVGGTNCVGTSPKVGVAAIFPAVADAKMNRVAVACGVGVPFWLRGAMASAIAPMI